MAEFVFADAYRLDQSPTRNFHETFLKGYLHKHNNLMGVIQGFSSLILYDDSITSEVRENAEQLQNAARAGSALNREVLGAAGCARCEPATIRLSDPLPYWESKSREICEASGVGFSLEVDKNLPPVVADSTRLGEIYFHLVRNAAEAAADFKGSPVEVKILGSDRSVEVFLRNRSVDLDEAALARAFVPFESSKGTSHFGIGLTAAAVLAGQMGMRLGLQNEGGATVAWLSIPAAV